MIHILNVFKKKLLVVFFEKKNRDEQTQLDFVSEKTWMNQFNSFFFSSKNRVEQVQPETVQKHRNGSIDTPQKPKIARKSY